MYVILIRAANDGESRIIGPFDFYDDAEAYLTTLPVAADCDWKYIEELEIPYQG